MPREQDAVCVALASIDKLRERNQKEWEFWMYRCCTDKKTGEKFGWGRVLDYIGVEWEDVPPVQMTLDDFM